MYKKSTLASAMLFVYALLSTGYSVFAQACNTDLKVSHDFDVRAAQVDDPTRFTFEITNNSLSAVNYQLTSATADGPCSGDDDTGRSQSGNVELVHSFGSGGRAVSTINVPARSTASFVMEVSVPRGTPSNQWSCIDVRATSSSCPQGIVKTVRVFVSNPDEN